MKGKSIVRIFTPVALAVAMLLSQAPVRAQDARHDRHDIHKDKRDLKHDRVDRNKDQRDINHDRRDVKRDRKDAKQDQENK